jgi:hypothetical protein
VGGKLRRENVTELSLTGTVLGTFSSGGSGRTGVPFDSANIRVTDFNNGTVTKLSAMNGGNLGSFSIGAQAAGIAFDDANIWASDFGGSSLEAVAQCRRPNLITRGIGLNVSAGRTPSGTLSPDGVRF